MQRSFAWIAQRHITARRRIGASEGASGCAALRRVAPPHGSLALVGLEATSPTCDPLCKMPCGKDVIGESGFRRFLGARDLDGD
jgi:hypothetical protein